MGVARRIAELHEVKMNAVLDRAEDPREMVDYSYAQLQELLAEVHRGAAEIAAGRRRAQMQVSGLQRSADQLQEQAEQAVAAGHEDLARQALARRTAILTQVADLRDQQTALRTEEAKLSAAARRLQAKIEAFRIQKETIKAAYTAARAECKHAPARWRTCSRPAPWAAPPWATSSSKRSSMRSVRKLPSRRDWPRSRNGWRLVPGSRAPPAPGTPLPQPRRRPSTRTRKCDLGGGRRPPIPHNSREAR